MADDFRTGYPERLELAERKLLSCSPKWSPGCDPGATSAERAAAVDPEALVGVGLSGGGIRSATFALGLFQGLARLGLLGQVDYLSTVSGGGYFGSFLGRLFTREYVHGVRDVEEILTLPEPDRPAAPAETVKAKVFPWLRENGRYLSPNGSGDLLLGGAVMFRNWVAVQVVLTTLILFFFLVAQLLRAWLEAGDFSSAWARRVYELQRGGFHWNLPFDLQLWGSPWILVGAALFLLWVLPFGWSYWMVRGADRRVLRLQIHPVLGLLAALAAGAWMVAVALADDDPSPRLLALLAAAAMLAVAALLTLGCWWLSATWARWEWRRELARRRGEPAPAPAEPEGPQQQERAEAAHEAATVDVDAGQERLFKDNWARHWLSVQLKGALMAVALVLLFTVVDSFGQTVYVVFLDPDSSFKAWAAGLLAALLALTGGARKLAVMLGGKAGDERPPAWSKALANVAAFALVFSVLVTVNAVSHAVAWRGDLPAYAPASLGRTDPPPITDVEALAVVREGGGWRIEEAREQEGGAPPEERGGAFRAPRHVRTAAWAAAGILVFSLLFGRSWPFLNRSTHLPLYSARLTRAYLGASNAWRHLGGQKPVTQVIPGDDLPVEEYWPTLRSPAGGWCARGAPLHLINVTVNETIDGRSQVEQRDRKGMGMAVGPAAMSAGVRHHVIFDVEAEEGRQFDRVEVFPGEGYRMFRYRPDPATGETSFRGHRLPLGQWLGISGAAFSTGIGARTSLGLSLLTGFANVRLGHWWDAGVPPTEKLSWLRLLFRGLFPVQNYVLDEFTARFPGSSRRHWYLSDGGHFENMGGYELIRRRLPFIVIVDAEADPEYTFGGLAGLVRKARLDFGAEVEFLDEKALQETLDEELWPYFGSLVMLRRGKWVEERRPTLKDRLRTREAPDPVDPRRASLAHASLARVYYDGRRDRPGSWLLYLKPTVRGDEPLDVLQYHGENPDFPQQTTADQFFDEAQWESYRRLGEHIALSVFQQPAAPAAGKWAPGSFRRP